jgi:hypothetical protein
MKRYLSLIVGLLLILFYCSGCGSNYHLKRAQHHLKKAELKGAQIHSDTVYIEKLVAVPEVKTDTVFKSEIGDTVFIAQDRLKIKYVRLPGDSVFIEGKCESDTIRMEIPVTIVKEIYPKKGFVFYLPWILVIIAVGVTAYFINSIRKKS